MKKVVLIKKKQKGQGLVEYSLILVLVAIVVISAMTVLGPVIGNVFSSINNSLGGGSGVTQQAQATAVPTTDPCPQLLANYQAAHAAYLACGGNQNTCPTQTYTNVQNAYNAYFGACGN